MFTPIHQHLLIKATVNVPITDPTVAKAFLVYLVKALGMTPVTAPQAVYVEEPGNEGLTGSINLATSHIAFHVWDKPRLLMMDVYSCKDFDNLQVARLVSATFGGTEQLSIRTMDRDTMEITYRFDGEGI